MRTTANSMGFNVNDPTAPTTSPPATSHNQQQQHSPWHSPVPYLFGGLAAMLGLIAFALLILACSYWKLSGYLEGGNGGDGGDGGGDLENPNGKPIDGTDVKTPPPVFDKVVVIMAGDEKPTFLATPMSSRASSTFGDSSKSNKSLDPMKEEKEESSPEEKCRGGDDGCSHLTIVPEYHHHQSHGDR